MAISNRMTKFLNVCEFSVDPSNIFSAFFHIFDSSSTEMNPFFVDWSKLKCHNFIFWSYWIIAGTLMNVIRHRNGKWETENYIIEREKSRCQRRFAKNTSNHAFRLPFAKPKWITLKINFIFQFCQLDARNVGIINFQFVPSKRKEIVFLSIDE